jgi:hypothetical protein
MWGYGHANSIFAEYQGKFDMLNITPGAVITENTQPFLANTPFACPVETFVRNVLRLLGNVQGNSCGRALHF